jgi:chromosome segregation ATPase
LEKSITDVELKIESKKIQLNNLDKTIRTTQGQVSELNTVLSSYNKSLKVAQSKLLESETIEQKVKEQKDILALIVEEQVSAKTELSEVNEKVKSSEGLLANTNDLIDQAKVILDGLQTDFESRKTKLDDELREILLKTQDAVRRLKKIQDEENSTRKSIAVERQALSKERESLNALKIKLGGAESRIKKLDGLIKL